MNGGFWQALVEAIKALWPSFVGLFKIASAAKAGQLIQRGADNAETLKRIRKAGHAASRVDLLDDADVVRQLHERRLYRIRGK